MKALTKEEAANIKVVPAGKGSLLRHQLITMKVGEIALVEQKDFNWKGKPLSTFIRRVEKTAKMKFTSGKALDGSGWVVTRVG
jgi:hypothetical protein